VQELPRPGHRVRVPCVRMEGTVMGEVLLRYRIMPEDVEMDVEELRERIEEAVRKAGGKLASAEKTPWAFGIEALRIEVIVPDAGGVLDRLEEGLKAVPGVGSVELESLTRLL